MSCYNWEAGTIQLPKSKFAKIKKQFIKEYNSLLEEQMNAGNKLREHILKINKGKRGVKWFWEIDRHLKNFGVSYSTSCKLAHDTEGKKPLRLTKKAMEFANTKTTGFDVDGEGSITFDTRNKTVSYEIWENNHSVERARESDVGKLFFRFMNTIEWTRGSGGSLYGNDEYNRHESMGNSGGGNYETAIWPRPKVDKRWRM